jgi:hypothetical protein
MKRTEANSVCRERERERKNRIWINSKIKQIKANNKLKQEIFLNKLSFLINSNWCYQYFVRTKVVTYCQNRETFYKDEENTSVTYKPRMPDLKDLFLKMPS